MALLTPSVFHMLTTERTGRLLHPTWPDLYFTNLGLLGVYKDWKN